MMQSSDRNTPIAAWLHELLHAPVQPYGDYFDRLRDSIASSAPVAGECR